MSTQAQKTQYKKWRVVANAWPVGLLMWSGRQTTPITRSTLEERKMHFVLRRWKEEVQTLSMRPRLTRIKNQGSKPLSGGLIRLIDSDLKLWRSIQPRRINPLKLVINSLVGINKHWIFTDVLMPVNLGWQHFRGASQKNQRIVRRKFVLRIALQKC